MAITIKTESNGKISLGTAIKKLENKIKNEVDIVRNLIFLLLDLLFSKSIEIVLLIDKMNPGKYKK